MNLRLIVLLCLVISILFFFNGCNGVKVPRIKFAERMFRFGEINEGDIVEHTFSFINAGTDTLEITEVKGTCGCTVPGDYTKEIEPGKTGEIPVRFNSAGFQGYVVKTIKVSTNIPDSETVNITLEGNINVLVELSTRTINLGQTKQDGPPLSGSVIVTNHTEGFMEIREVKTEDEGPVTNIIMKEEGQQYAIEVIVPPPFLIDHIRKGLTIKTNIKGKEEINLQYYYYGITDIEVAPKEIVIFLKHLQPDLNRIITVRSHIDVELEIINLRTNHPHLEASMEILVPWKHMQVILHFKEGFTFPADEAVSVSFGIKTDQGVTEYTIPVKNGDTY